MAVLAVLAGRKPRVIFDLGDELEMAQMCETLWPGQRITKLRKAVEAERKGG
jgi:hypothetical protein